MAKLRPARTMRKMNSQAWSRYSRRTPKKNFVRAMPATRLLVFRMGVLKDYDTSFYLIPEDDIKLRSNSLESARMVANKYLERNVLDNYYFRILVYPHDVIREHKMAAGAGADRLSKGMTLNFGRPISIAAAVRRGQPVFVVKTNKINKKFVVEAYKRATSKLSGSFKIKAS